MKGWSGGSTFGMVETIFEESEEEKSDEEDNKEGEVVKSECDLSSPPLSPLSCPSSPDLDSIVDAWSLARRRRPDVKIHVQGSCFHLHKDVLSTKSGYLKRLLTEEIEELTLSPPLKITADTFKQIAEFCYNLRLTITPFNVAALRTAAEALEMSETAGDDGVESLRLKTESFFCRFVGVNSDFASIVFRSCLSLLPEAEETAFLASRCLEVLCCSAVDEDSAAVDVMKTVRPEEFMVVADSMKRRFTRSHDFLYAVIDLYFKVYDGKMSEEEKTQICSCIDCNMISPQLLMEAVQNPRMPLRFVVQAMLTEQLNTQRSICSTTITATRSSDDHPSNKTEPPPANDRHNAPTLGAILQRDAALRQVAQLKSAINTTTSRIHSLEKELGNMKKLLIESERHRGVVDSGRSASFRFSKESSSGKKIERGERGSISSDNLRFRVTSNTTESSSGTPRLKKNNLGLRLIKGLKSVFRVPDNLSSSKDSKIGGSGSGSGLGSGKVNVDHEDDYVFKGDRMSIADHVILHSRNRSIS